MTWPPQSASATSPWASQASSDVEMAAPSEATPLGHAAPARHRPRAPYWETVKPACGRPRRAPWRRGRWTARSTPHRARRSGPPRGGRRPGRRRPAFRRPPSSSIGRGARRQTRPGQAPRRSPRACFAPPGRPGLPPEFGAHPQGEGHLGEARFPTSDREGSPRLAAPLKHDTPARESSASVGAQRGDATEAAHSCRAAETGPSCHPCIPSSRRR
jgi:hypothetical protein